MRRTLRLTFPAWLLVLVTAAVLMAPAAHAAPAATDCAALKGVAFAGLQDAPTSVMTATYVSATAARPAYCALEGYVAPNSGFALWLPTQWNGKLLVRGCGGFCGITAGEFACKDPIRLGYACVQTDMGHKSTLVDAAWAYNNSEAEIDFAYRATHGTTLAAKGILARYYGAPAKRSYMLGCSTGGRQGMVEAERFPDDFDGIISVAPAINETGASIQLTWSMRSNRNAADHNILSPAKLPMLHQAVLDACDLNDGVKDGVIGDPAACRFRPASLTCRAGADTATCLTPAEVAVVEKIYTGPHDSHGRALYPGGAPVGSEGHWDHGYIGAADAWGSDEPLETDFWRYMAFLRDPGPSFTLDKFDFDHDPARLGGMETLYSGTNPDLRRLKAAGGKLLLVQGMSDDNIVPGQTIDFYKGATRFMGGEAATLPFFRLFAVPGMYHCTGGDGAYAIDYLSALERWVEAGVAPDMLVGAHPKDGVEIPYLGVGLRLAPEQIGFRRPHFAWPSYARYIGRGDPDDPANWTRVRSPAAGGA